MFKKDYEDVKEVGEEERDGVMKLKKAIKSSHTETLDAWTGSRMRRLTYDYTGKMEQF